MRGKLGICLCLICLFIFSPHVFAKGKLDLTADKNSARFGDEITVSVHFNNADKDLYAYVAKLSYDEDVFEKIGTENFINQGNWSDVIYNTENHRVAFIRKSGKETAETDDENILQVKFKIKDDAGAGKTVISLNSITASDGEKDTRPDSQSVEVEVIKNGLALNESIPVNKPYSIEEDNISVKLEKEAPGLAVLFIALSAAMILFMVWFDIKKENRGRDKIAVTIAGVILSVLLLIPAIENLTPTRPDVDRNGVVDYEDTREIINYLLEIEKPQEDEDMNDKDLNKDGKITAADIAKSLDYVKNQDYKVELQVQ